MSTIITKNSANSGSKPSTLVQGELAINVFDGKLYYGSGSAGVVKEFNTSSFSVSSSYALSASYALQSTTSSNSLTASYLNPLNQTVVITGSLITSGSNTFTGITTQTGSLILTGSTAINSGTVLDVSAANIDFDFDTLLFSGSTAFTGSVTISGSTTITGSLNVTNTISASSANFGTITANSASITYLTTIFETASIIYSTGSNQFGDASNDVQTLWGTVDIKTGPVLVTGSMSISGSLNAPSITGSLFGTASWANNAITASYALTASSALNAQDILIYVKNVTGAQINKGTVVRISGATGDNALISTASYTDDNNSANTLGITNENIANDSFGYVMTEGKLIGIDTSAFTAGQLLYLGPTGSIIGTAPVAPLHGVRLGQVLRVQLNNGSMYVRIDNGYELGELHDVVDLTTTASYGDLLVKSGSVWINSKQLTGSYGLTGSFVGGSFSGSFSGSFQGNGSDLTNIPASGITGLNLSQIATGSVSASVSPGTASFQVTSGSTNFLFVSSSGNIGIGTTTPTSAKLQVSGSTSALGLQGSGSGVFTVDGTSGRLFSVDDSLSGSLFSVNTAAGLPLIEAFSDNTVRIGQFGQRALFVSQSAVGIGVETLTAKLQVSGSNSERLLLVGSPASSSILFVTGSGLVGIGTNTPANTLDVSGTGRIVGAGSQVPLTLTAASAANNTMILNHAGLYNAIQLNNNSSVEAGVIGWGNSSGVAPIQNSFYFLINRANVAAASLRFTGYNGTSIENYMTIVGSTGNVGIGTTNPGARLEVSGSTVITGSLTVITGSAIELQVTNTGVKIGNASTDTHTVTGSLQVAGQTRISGSFNTAVSGTILTVIGSGSTQPIFTVQGSQGELFSVTDSLTGSLFSVNDISGLPILEVFSDSTTNIGNYLAPAVYTTNKITQTNSGSFVVYSLPTASYDGAFYDYTVRSGSNARAGQIMAIWSGSSVNFTETTTTSFGSTSAINFTVIVSGSNMVLTGSSATGSWTIKTIIRSI